MILISDIALLCEVLILVIGLLIGYHMWRHRSISCLLYISTSILFGLVPLLQRSWTGDLSHSSSVILKANVIVLGGMLSLLIGHLAARRVWHYSGEVTHATPHAAHISFIHTIAIVLFSFISLSSLLYILFWTGDDIATKLETPRLELREDGVRSHSLTAVFHLSNLGVVAIYLAMLRRRLLLVALTIFTLYVLLAIVYGARSYLLLASSPLLSWLLSKHFRRSLLGYLVFYSAILCVGFSAMGVLHLHRWQERRTLGSITAIATTRTTYTFVFADTRSELNMRIALYKAAEHFPNTHDWLYGNTYKCMLLFWLPRQYSFGHKTDTMYLFADAVLNTAEFKHSLPSAHPTFYGDLYINFGPFWWVGAMCWGVGIVVLEASVRRTPHTAMGIVAGAYLPYFYGLALRGSIYQPFVAMACSFILSSMILWVLRRTFGEGTAFDTFRVRRSDNADQEHSHFLLKH